jgi:HK97 family phage major capsid protein
MFGPKINVNEVNARMADLRKRRKAVLNEREIDALSTNEKDILHNIDSQLGFCGEQLREHEAGSHMPGENPHKRNKQPIGLDFNGLVPKDGADEFATVPAWESISSFIRTGKILATDTPLNVITSPVSSGLSAAIPKEILQALPAYFRNDAFLRAGATQIYTDSTIPLVMPIISAGADFDPFAEGASATESHPFQADDFTFGGQKYSRLVKVSEESLMNSALDLPSSIVAELAAGVVNSFTKTTTDALMAALYGNVGVTYIDRSQHTDLYGALLALVMAVPPRWDAPTNAFMLSRFDLQLVKNVRSTQNEPLFDPEANTIFGRPVVINDNLDRIVYGNWQAGAYVRKTPFVLLRLFELYSASGYQGFKATQYLDSKFLASVSSVSAQPLFFTNADSVGS